jgi:feruloyl esterase
MTRHIVLAAAVSAALCSPGAAFGQEPIRTCDSLSSLALSGGTITAATAVPATQFWAANSAPTSTPENETFCRVTATLQPSSDSDIRIEVWLPLSGWNGKFHAAGGALGANSAVGGSINYPPMLSALRGGYATAGTDGGHTGATLSFAPGHPEQVIDFGYRAVHEMTVSAKALIAEFYGRAPEYSYWNACAAGGRQGWHEVQRYPQDYDGLVVTDPANYWTALQTWSLWIWQAAHETDASFIPPAKYSLIHDAVINACDALDGVNDGVLEDPTQCEFDPGVLTCQADDGAACLTPAQVTTARRIYAPATNPRTSAEIFPGLMPGSEMAWNRLAGPTPPYYATETFKYLAFNDPAWSAETDPVDFDIDVARLDDAARVLNANDADLAPFFARGGKIIAAAGWNDPLISPLNSVDLHERVATTVGREQTDAAYRLFMVPGMTHCRGGDGTDTFDLLSALERWVEEGEAPDRIVASRVTDGTVVRTRPLCPYPQVAMYTGAGSTDEAASFVCRVPAP